ncbi:hypothetical protein [Lactobacillus acetotolerans]|uniref:hypothetical protein n=1 Tax=Lactobacillus acetotolerans TaxID=1600 RepID=UPI002FD9729A
MEMLNQIVDILTKVGFFSLTGWGLREWVMYIRHKKEQQDAMKNGVLAMLHHELYVECSTYINQGYITTSKLDDLNYIFRSYKALGGNGTGEILYNRASKLDIRKDDDYAAS